MKILRNNKKPKDCGVVAAYNAASWSNRRVPYKKIEKVARSCGYNPENGIYSFQFSNLIKKLGLPAKKVRPRDITDVQNRLAAGNLFLFLYTRPGMGTGHVITVFCYPEEVVWLVNPDKKKMNWKQFKEDLAEGMKNFSVWEIENKEIAK